MDKLPHDYLQSKYKERIEIIFKVEDCDYLMILRYRVDKVISQVTERIDYKGNLEDHIRSAEDKLVRELKVMYG